MNPESTGRMLATLLIGGMCAYATPALGLCKLAKLAELPIVMEGMRPLTAAKINDHDVQFTVDSGAFYSMLSTASAAQLELRTREMPFGFYVRGTNGTANVSIATVKVFMLAGASLHNIDFLVGGSDISGSIGLLGQNILHIKDVEYDLGNGVIRLLEAKGCSNAFLAYWTKPGDGYSVIDIAPASRERFNTIGSASVNGVGIRVLFDTGAGPSILTLAAAARAGITPNSPGVVAAGLSGGVGRRTYRQYIAPFASFKIGNEEIKNTRLRIADTDLGGDADMLIGPDFFLSHRIYVANGQHKLFFTYNGGPVFKLPDAAPIHARASTPQHDGLTAAQPAVGMDAGSPTDSLPTQEPQAALADRTDAADLSRRGTALAARRDFEHALADLDQACRIAPDNADYAYQRGSIHWHMGHRDLALQDLDRAIKLRPDYAQALLARSELKLAGHDKEAALADLEAADAVFPRQVEERLTMAHLYEHLDQLDRANAQFDLWIQVHPEDMALPEALNGRCWVRTLRGVDLTEALKDCNTALKRVQAGSLFFAKVSDSRGLLYLRLGQYDKSIADYDRSLKINPRNARSLYGRGLAKMHRDRTAEGQDDLDAAVKIWPGVAEEFKRYGLSP